MTNQQKQAILNSHKLNILAEMCSYRIEELLESLEIEYKKIGKAFHGCCPVHGGDRKDAWNFYPDGHTVRGIWACRSRSCEKHFVKNIIGLVRGVLSARQGWNPDRPKEKVVNVEVAKNYLLNFLGKKWSDISADDKDVEKSKFISQINILGQTSQIQEEGWPISQIKAGLSFPAKYYLQRGYSSQVLDYFMVGEPKSPKKNSKMIDRVVVPILNKSGTKVLGVTGRSIFEKCPKCSKWHNPELECPTGEALYYPSFAKWRNIDEFETRHHIYNLWNNLNSKSIVVVEGPGDVWRLKEAGIDNAVALFGCSLSDQQQILLESSKVMNIYLLLDEDKAGKNGIQMIKESLDRMFNIKVLSHLLDKKDVGEMSVTQIKEKICPVLLKI